MARPATGTVQWQHDHYKVRVRLPDGKRPWIHLAPELDEAAARAKAAELSTLVRERGATVPNTTLTATELEVVEKWFERWVARRDARKLRSIRHDRARFAKYIAPFIGTRSMTAVTRTHLEDIVEHLDGLVDDETLAWKTARNIWAVVTKMFKDACSAKRGTGLRARDDNPCAGIEAPARGATKAKTFLYPNEFLALVNCAAVPLTFRELYAVAVYLYLRAGEERRIRWQDVDFEHGMVHLHRAWDAPRGEEKPPKGNAERTFALEPTLLPLLRAMHARATSDFVFPDMPEEKEQAKLLREHLTLAGVTRAALFTSDATHKRMTFHDLRATGITWMAARKDNAFEIQARAGHQHFATTEQYIRLSAVTNPSFGKPFPDLPIGLLGPVQWSPIGLQGTPDGAQPMETTSELVVRGGGLERRRTVPVRNRVTG